MKNVELTSAGLKCDNPNCNWKDSTIEFDSYKDWINRPCPNCGSNLLTLEDYKNAEIIMQMADYFNNLTEEEIENIEKDYDIEELKNSSFLKDANGLENLDSEGCKIIEFSTHKDIKITNIKNCEDGN